MPAARACPAAGPSPTITTGTRYRIVAGDSLSSIAARVRDRSGFLWAMADAIQAANPEAFIRNDPNLIKLGQRNPDPRWRGRRHRCQQQQPVAGRTGTGCRLRLRATAPTFRWRPRSRPLLRHRRARRGP